MVMGQQWLWQAMVVAVMLGRGWAIHCPDKVCSCHLSHDQLFANCSSLPNKGGEVVDLTLSPNRDTILHLRNGQFNSFKHLKYLTLRNTSIYEVQNKTFYGATKIVEIDLSFNYIKELDATVFEHLDKLTTVSLRGNPIVLVQETPFLISNSISHLDIGQCKIEKIPERVFYELKRLTHLTLDGNLIQSIEINLLPKGLRYLNLANNDINNVQLEVFYALPNLKQLNLIGNPINCSCSLMNLIERYKSSNDVILEDVFNCTFSQKNKELCVVEAAKEKKRTNFNLDEHEQADQPVTEILMGNNNTLEVVINEKEKNENVDINKINEQYEDPDKRYKNISIANNGNMDVETTSNESSDDTYKATTYSTSEAADTNDLNSQKNFSKIEADDKVIGDEKYSITVIPDKISESSTKVSEKNDHGDANTNINATDNQILSSPLYENSNIEYDKNKISNSQEEDLQTDFIMTVTTDKSQVDTNITSSELTINAGFEEINSEGSGQGPNNPYESDSVNESLTSTTEINNNITDAKSQEDEESETEFSSKDTENISESELTNNLTSDVITENKHPEATESPTPSNTSENEQLSPVVDTTELTTYETPNNETETFGESRNVENRVRPEGKIQEMAGAEVVMFCVAILIICLVLFSIYKCRSSKNRQSMSDLKDIESNRGTELQDMASLLPKPEEKDEKKNNLKYEDKAPSSETVKLLSEQNENDSSNFIPVTETKTKLEDKNSLNNNTPSSKVPLIKPEKPVTINPTAPIQRTKVKVGIIPDSIPRTPIFLQKTYNGTKNV